MLAKKFFNDYEKYKEQNITHRRFKHPEYHQILESYNLKSEVYGHSFEGREIKKIRFGTGPMSIIFWSQMHGDEATASMALLDIFKFLTTKNDEYDEFRKRIFESFTLDFLPLLNPDGAERFQRRTSQDIDMNRDALRLQSPESVLLKKLQNETQAEFAFNLHDQNPRYSVGKSKHQAVVSFLATAYNEDRNWNEKRIQSHQVISEMNKALQEFVPNGVGRYSDEFEPRAFGDNIMKWGSSLILIESGGYATDPENQYIRKLNFVAILAALDSISKHTYKHNALKEYESIPLNDNYLFDFLIRNATKQNGIKIDLGINLYEKNESNATTYKLNGVIEDIGDLSTFWGLKELDASKLQILPIINFKDIIEKYNIDKKDQNEVKLGGRANFILAKNSKPKYLIKNGVLIEL